MTITAPDGTALVLGEPAGCHLARGASFGARPGVQFVESAALPSKEQGLTNLVVTIDDHTVNVPLLPICTGYDPPTTGCADDTLSFDGGSGYSATLALD